MIPQGSKFQWKCLNRAWAKNLYACPACGHFMHWNQMTPLQMNPCTKCGEPFYMPRKLGDYFLFEPAGGGGMGTVYKAVSDRYPDKLLAVKLLTRAACQDPTNIRALLNECEISSKFRESEFIVSCLDHGYQEGEFFTVMPYLSGERLDKRIERQGKIPYEEAKVIMMHLLAAEQHIYNCGYLFRDMKPENVIVTEKGYAVLLDFGLCISLEAAQKCEDEYVSGSPYYMPPERLLGEPELITSEIYSLGMLFYHLLTGHTLYDANGLNELANKHIAKLRVSNSSKLHELPPEALSLVESMIAQNPAQRPQSFRSVYDQLI